jgi:hypothetical protein
MQIPDLVDTYITDVLRDRAIDRYERRMPELFEHVGEYWNHIVAEGTIDGTIARTLKRKKRNQQVRRCKHHRLMPS